MLIFQGVCSHDFEDPNQFYALAIGFVIVAGGHAVGAVSGAALNPALALSLGNTSGKVGGKFKGGGGGWVKGMDGSNM